MRAPGLLGSAKSTITYSIIYIMKGQVFLSQVGKKLDQDQVEQLIAWPRREKMKTQGKK
jgi:hypothetical protein